MEKTSATESRTSFSLIYVPYRMEYGPCQFVFDNLYHIRCIRFIMFYACVLSSFGTCILYAVHGVSPNSVRPGDDNNICNDMRVI